MSTIIGSISAFDSKTCRFNTYVSRLRAFFAVNKIKLENQVNVFITVMGDEMFELLINLSSPADPTTKTFDELVAILANHYEPACLEVAERQHFLSRRQKDSEPISSFVADLKRLAITCNYGDHLSAALRDQLVSGLRNDSVKRKLLTEPQLTFEKAVTIAQQLEVANKELTSLQSITPSSSTSVNKVENRKTFAKKSKDRSRPSADTTKPSSGSCHRCGSKDHWAPKCPHISKTCNKCKKKGHLAKVCRGTNAASTNNTGVSDGAVLHTTRTGSTDAVIIPVSINSTVIDMELDTGATFSLIGIDHWKRIGSPKVSISSINLRTYNQQSIPVHGQFNASVTINGKTDKASIIVVRSTALPALLGRDLLSKFPLDWTVISKKLNSGHDFINSITIDDISRHYPELFKPALGLVSGIKASIKLREGVTPKFCKPRPVPYALKAKIETDLERLVKLGVLSPVLKADWAAPIVPVMKPDGTVRICGDFRITLNPVIQPDWYPLPTTEDLFSELSKYKVFSKLDLKDAYLQVELDEKSKDLAVINTHKGLFRYNRLPFGFNFAPSIFQFVMEDTTKDMDFVKVFIDDCFIGGEDQAKHDANLHKLLKRLQDRGMRLRKDKCLISQSKVEYLGHLIDATGVKPLSKKIDAILKAPKPTNVSELRTFLGLVNYYGNFIQDMNSIGKPLFELLKDNVEWQWTRKQDNAFNLLRTAVTSDSTLVHYDSTLPLILECDASGIGVGCALSHKLPNGDIRPVAFASKSLSKAERNYSQIEREALAIIFGVKKFHKYLFGRHFSIVTDHKPLIIVLGPKGHILTVSASRLHRWSNILQSYDFSISFRTTKEHANVDYLSRFPLPITDDPCLPKDISNVSNTIAFLEDVTPCPVTYKEVRESTKKDKQLLEVIRHIQSGWPYDKCPNDRLKPFFNHRFELSYEDGCLLFGLRLVIPTSLRKRILDSLHECHTGIVRMKSIARSYVWWPGIDAAVEEVSRACKSCAKEQSSPPKATVHPWSYPTRPWQRLHIDLCGPVFGKTWLVVVDAHSKWLELVFYASMPNCDQVIRSLLSIFSRFGLPEEMVSDNGTQFTASQFKLFCDERGIKHRLTAPYHPASNGEAERFVRVFKDGMRPFENNKDWEYNVLNFLLSYRTTPNTVTGRTPAELMFSRNLRTKWDLLRYTPKVKSQEQTGKQSRSFIIGDTVWARDYRNKDSKWIEGSILEVLVPRNYKVSTKHGIWKRHINQLRKRILDLPDVNSEQSETTTGQSETEAEDTTTAEQVLRRGTRIRCQPDRYDPCSNNFISAVEEL